MNNLNLFASWQCIATAHQDVPGMYEEIIMWAMFRDRGSLEKWKATEGVHFMSHPLEEDELCDGCMAALGRYHNMEPIDAATNLPVALPTQAAVKWRDKATQAQSAKPHTRKLMKQVGKLHMPDFTFEVFV